MTNFLYCYKDDGHDGRDLRYSLRSLEAFWQGDVDITVVGDRPSWLVSAEVLEGPTSANKVQNILIGVLRGAEHLWQRGVDDAIYMDDDYVLTDPADKVFPIYVSSWDEFYAKRNRLHEQNFQWFLDGMDSSNRVIGGVPEALCFEAHRPMPFVVSKAATLLSNFETVPADRCPFWRSTYGNLALPREQAVWGRDVRAVPSFKPGSAWSSTDAGKTFEGPVANRLKEWFPNPSRWEASL